MSAVTTVAPRSPATAAAAPLFWDELTDVAGQALGGRVLFATDDWFACAEKLIAPQAPKFDPQRFTAWGKWMDGWETRRKRVAGHDWCVIALGAPARVYGFEVDTGFFTGNQAPRLSIQGAFLPGRAGEHGADAALLRTRHPDSTLTPDQLPEGGYAASDAQRAAARSSLGDSTVWAELLPRVPLAPGYEDTRHHRFTAAKVDAGGGPNVITHLRVNLYPDGGVARLRVRGEICSRLPSRARADVAAAANGGAVLGASNAHYGRPSNLIAPGRSQRMDQGWETARNPNRPAVLGVRAKDGMLDLPPAMAEWTIIRLGCPAVVDRVEIDTDHFKGNCPEACTLECARVAPGVVGRAGELAHCLSSAVEWHPLLHGRERLSPHSQHAYTVVGGQLTAQAQAVTHVRLRMYPDGGIARLRVFGVAMPEHGEAKM